MPFVEVISFVASDALHHDLSREDSPLRQLSACEGCLDLVQGRQVEDTHRLYFIATWKSYEVYDQATRGTSYASFMASLVQHDISDASVQHFEVDGDPHRALTAPVTEIVFLKSKEADWRWNQEMCIGIAGAQRGLYFVEGGHPPLRWGEVKDGTGRYFMLVGWDSVEAHFRAAKEKPLKKHVRHIRHTTSLIDARHIIFKSLRPPHEERYMSDRMAGYRIQSSL